MSSFILQLLVISAFGLMVQSAPIHDVTKRSTDMNRKNLEMRLFCKTEFLYKELKVNFTVPLTEDDNDTDTIAKRIANEIFNHFSFRCKHFTKAMTLKHRFQEHLFSNNSRVALNSDNVKTLSTILTTLQLFAKIFNDLELIENNSRCVKLTPAQYRIMYYAQYNTTSLLESWEKDIGDWYMSDDHYKAEGSKHCDKV